ncbi:MAG: hypothetical protein MJK12_01315 [Colwellia sp.]|nr:hypothetical protein [Colwellia sp.]
MCTKKQLTDNAQRDNDKTERVPDNTPEENYPFSLLNFEGVEGDEHCYLKGYN